MPTIQERLRQAAKGLVESTGRTGVFITLEADAIQAQPEPKLVTDPGTGQSIASFFTRFNFSVTAMSPRIARDPIGITEEDVYIAQQVTNRYTAFQCPDPDGTEHKVEVDYGFTELFDFPGSQPAMIQDFHSFSSYFPDNSWESFGTSPVQHLRLYPMAFRGAIGSEVPLPGRRRTRTGRVFFLAGTFTGKFASRRARPGFVGAGMEYVRRPGQQWREVKLLEHAQITTGGRINPDQLAIASRASDLTRRTLHPWVEWINTISITRIGASESGHCGDPDDEKSNISLHATGASGAVVTGINPFVGSFNRR